MRTLKIIAAAATLCLASCSSGESESSPPTPPTPSTVPPALVATIKANADPYARQAGYMEGGSVSDVSLSNEGVLIIQTTLLERDPPGIRDVVGEAICSTALEAGWDDEIEVLAPNGDVIGRAGEGLCDGSL